MIELPEQLTLLEQDWTVLRGGRRPRRDRGWLLAWVAPLQPGLILAPVWIPPPGSQVIDRVVGRGRWRRRELWVRPRPRRRRRSSGS